MSQCAANTAPLAARVSAALNTSQIFPNAFVLTVPSILQVPASGKYEQKLFRIRGSGFVTTAGNFTVLPTLFSGTSLVPGNNTIIGAGTARAVNTTSCPWWFEAKLMFDSVSGKLQGVFQAMVNNLFDADAAVTNVVAAVSGIPGAAEPALQFVIGITFGTANAANIANLADFELVDA